MTKTNSLTLHGANEFLRLPLYDHLKAFHEVEALPPKIYTISPNILPEEIVAAYGRSADADRTAPIPDALAERLQALDALIDSILEESERFHVEVVIPEFGFGMVPMRVGIRWRIRLLTDRLSKLTQRADAYLYHNTLHTCVPLRRLSLESYLTHPC